MGGITNELIVWNDAFSVGVQQLDAQHKHLVDLFNQLVSASDVAVESELISEVLLNLVNYADEHFGVEERLLAAVGYPDMASHREGHRGFLRHVVGFSQATIEQQRSVPDEVKAFLRTWLTDHILVSDMNYRSFLNDRGVR